MIHFNRRWKPVFLVAIPTVVTSLLIGGALNHLQKTDSGTATAFAAPLPVRVATVEAGIIEEIIGAEGVAESSGEVPLRSNITSRIVKMNARLGDTARVGQVLIQLDPTLPRAAMVRAESQVSDAVMRLELNSKRLADLKDLFEHGYITEDEWRRALIDRSKAADDVAAAEKELVGAREDLAATVIRSPVAGVVTVRDVNAGTLSKQQSDLMTIGIIDPIHVKVDLTEDKTRSVFVGQSVDLSFFAYPGQKFQGSVAIINPVLDEKSRLLSVIVRLRNTALELKPGMRGIVNLKNTRDGLRIPSIALMSEMDQAGYVFVVDKSDIAHLRSIRVGARSQEFVQVAEGLNAGDRVVVVGQAGLSNSSKVRIGDEYAKH
jgi:membrane fusion protein (multidrug efflux system)